jgi:hypothetical protein
VAAVTVHDRAFHGTVRNGRKAPENSRGKAHEGWVLSRWTGRRTRADDPPAALLRTGIPLVGPEAAHRPPGTCIIQSARPQNAAGTGGRKRLLVKADATPRQANRHFRHGGRQTSSQAWRPRAETQLPIFTNCLKFEFGRS